MNKSTSTRRAYSPVISALILSTVVLVVGGGVWAFSQGAMRIIADDYAENLMNMTDTISERFIIEQVMYNSEMSTLHVWVFNYGNVDIDIKVRIGDVTYSENWIHIASGEMVAIDPIDIIVNTGDELNVNTFSRRNNNAYYRYLVP